MRKIFAATLIILLFLFSGCAASSNSPEQAPEEEEEEQVAAESDYRLLNQLLIDEPTITDIIGEHRRYLGININELLETHTSPGGMFDEYYYDLYDDGSERFWFNNMQVFFSGPIWAPDSKTVALNDDFYELFPKSISTIEEMDDYFNIKGKLCKSPEETYLSYIYEDVELRIYTNSGGTQLSLDTRPELVLIDFDHICIKERNNEEKTTSLPSEALHNKKFKALSAYTSCLVMTKEEILKQNKKLKPIEDVGGPWYYTETWGTDDGDLYGFDDCLGSILVSASKILPIAEGEKLTREEFLAYWPFCHSWSKQEYTFIFTNDNDARNPICVWIYSNDDGSIDYDACVHIKFFNGYPT